MADFTPGPWSVTNPPHVIRRKFYDEQGRRCTDWIAECCNQIRQQSQTEANARLIAAAPRLYAACEALLERYLIMGCGEGPEAMEARAALTLATGEKQA